MGIEFQNLQSYYEFGEDYPFEQFPRQVLDLAVKVVKPILDQDPGPISHLIIATTCPDSIAPSVGQHLSHVFNSQLKDAHVIDIVQGCAGGVTALLLASQLASIHLSKVLVVMADAARKACDKDSQNYENFGNGSFACIIEGGNYQTGLMHFKSKQYKELLEVVHVRLGHDADEVLAKGITINHNPRKYLGLEMKNELAIKLLQRAKSFYEDFVSEVNIEPDMIILHQVNPKIIRYLEGVFLKEKISFVNVSDKAGNCGTASVGIALKHAESDLKGKKVLICSFGTGGVITAGLWQY